MQPLVSTDWLAQQLGSPDLVVFDATMYLPNEAKDGRTEYLAAHIPGASLLLQPGVSHFSFLQDPEQFTNDVLHFLQHVHGH